MPAALVTSWTPTPPWRRRYWHLRRWLDRARDQVRLRRDLARLGRQVRRAPALGGIVRLGGLTLHCREPASLYSQFKLIFADRVYDFPRPSPGALILDGGGHIGLSALRFRQLAPDARIITFEPDPQILPILRRNLAENGADAVEVVAAALGAATGTRRFRPDPADGGALVPGDAAPAGGTNVPVAQLSDYLAEPVYFLKLNVEGAEHEVLHEAAGRLHRVQRLVIEYHGFPHLRQNLHQILEILDDCGFRYAISHLDYGINPALRPPFQIGPATRYFTWIAATRLGPPRDLSRCAGAAPAGPPASVSERCQPASRQFGFDRGEPIDRFYIARFLAEHAADVRGSVLEIGDDRYTRRFGGPRVRRADVLNPGPGPGTSVVADLGRPGALPAATWDCIILTQTLPFIFDVAAVIRNCHAALRPGGALLLTVPGISQTSRYDQQRWGDFWRFTPTGVQRLLSTCFEPAAVRVRAHGNVRAACAFLHGLAREELHPAELELQDEEYPVIIAARAWRAG